MTLSTTHVPALLALSLPPPLPRWASTPADPDPQPFSHSPTPPPAPRSNTRTQGYPGKFYCPRMATMNKPAYAAIQTHSPLKPVLVFVSSRRQTRLTALDLIAHAAADERPRAFLRLDERELQAQISGVKASGARVSPPPPPHPSSSPPAPSPAPLACSYISQHPAGPRRSSRPNPSLAPSTRPPACSLPICPPAGRLAAPHAAVWDWAAPRRPARL